VALDYLESLHVAGSKGHDMAFAKSVRLQPLKYRFGTSHTQSKAPPIGY
jgi:hypothetical protein